MKNRHDWTEDGVPHSVDRRALAHDSWAACLQREILRLAGFKETLEQVALAAGCLPTQFPDAYDGHVLERVAGLAARVKELEAEVGPMLAALGDLERIERSIGDCERASHLEAIAGPLLPLFRERFDLNARRAQARGVAARMPDTITLTAEFPVEALRALTKE